MDLRDWMTLNDLSNADLAAKLGVAANTVSRWRNRTRMPRPREMKLIAEASAGEVTANDFFAPRAEPCATAAMIRREVAA
ncbi:HTH_XRE domain containing protein [uncultured Caudovirales phage]|uniref:HTH_XRE domain containing protein n=1 Tax=uncultured Caudovirales phage TaxID=2100421 RepID=A0A6J5KWS3_9CAUD|nr:HTH_XRE domain containing protein [uncultured Caudovirales phage]